MGADIGKLPEGEGKRKRGAEGGALIVEIRDFRAETGQRGEGERRGSCTT